MSGARPSMRFVAYQGRLIGDFGGVITTDFYACWSAFCVREGRDGCSRGETDG